MGNPSKGRQRFVDPFVLILASDWLIRLSNFRQNSNQPSNVGDARFCQTDIERYSVTQSFGDRSICFKVRLIQLFVSDFSSVTCNYSRYNPCRSDFSCVVYLPLLRPVQRIIKCAIPYA